MFSKRIELTGNVYGRLTVIGYSHTDKQGDARWRVRCQCGNESVTSGKYLRSGRTKSCGCLKTEVNRVSILVAKDESLRLAAERANRIKLSGTKSCSNPECPEINPQPISRFGKTTQTLSRLKSHCKTCISSGYLKSAMGITGPEKESAIESQNGKCAIPGCHRSPTVADHNHDTERFRAVLCRSCNIAEGLLRDVDRIRGLLEYRLHHDAIDYPEEKIT